MDKFRPEQTSVEKLARTLSGPESEATHFYVGGASVADDVLLKEKTEKFNNTIDELQEKFQTHIDTLQETGKQIASDMANLEIMPLTCYALITPYKTNPFQRIATSSSGLITDLGGLTPTYKSQETGDVEEEEPYVKVGMVVEVGTECKFVKPGDIVFYNVASEVMVPFFRFGFVIVAEQRLIAVVNEKLTERKENVLNKK